MSIQGYLQQRKRLNLEVFSYLNDEYLMDFYDSDEPDLWKGYLLLAIDGSKAEVQHPERYERMKEKKEMEVRIAFVTLPLFQINKFFEKGACRYSLQKALLIS